MKKFLRTIFTYDNFSCLFTLRNVTLALALIIPIIVWMVRKRSVPPGPFTFPIFGSFQLLGVDGKSLNKTLIEIGKKYGPIFRINLGNCYLTVVQGHDLIQEALTNGAEYFQRRPVWLHTAKAIYNGKGIIWGDGTEWQTINKIAGKTANQFVTSKSVMEATIQEEIRLILNELYLEKCRPINLRLIISNAVYNILSTLTFGERLEYDRSSCRTFKENLQSLALADIMRMPENYQIYSRWFSKKVESLSKTRSKIIEFLEPRLTNHKSAFVKRESKDFIDICVQHIRDGDSKLDDEDVLQSMIDLFTAGCEPTVSVLMWAFLFMVRYPEMQKRCRFEIMKAMSNSKNPSWGDRDKMLYVQAVLLEVKRFASAMSCGLPHTMDTDLELGGYRIPRGDIVIFHQYASHMDPTYWKRPSEFRPENFIDSDGKLIQHVAFFPYGHGPRACPFSSVTDKILYLTFTSILTQYELRSPDDSPMPSTDSVPGTIRFPKNYYVCPYPIES
ncbi:hypothetical protein FSP39_016124 [Pinctada imbricata]|uniref:Cytochrome P450 n=1 Tax=Pinctada imbricata TaxID=66713 RepID=A0AA88XWZ7_PINIB|nr:hypothetical protein FSP39_016124 [Pinctada imbricata]